MNDAIQKATLIAFDEGRVSHLNRGLCPDQVAGHDSRDPDCSVCRALSAPSSEQAQQGANTAVYLVATGELHEGEETYTRHEDHPPPMCDFERLWMDRPAAPAVGVTELIALADAYAETRHALGPAEHSGTTNTSRNVLRTALAGAAQEAEPQKYDDTLLPFLALMRRELHANSTKGDRPGWLSMTPQVCLLEIYWHVSKLSVAVRDGDPARIAEHCALTASTSTLLTTNAKNSSRYINHNAS